MPTMPPDKAKKMQAMLNKVIKPKPPLSVDGIVGPKTKEAIKSLQKKANLRATGEIDGETAIVVVRAMKTGKLEKEAPTKFIHLGGGKYAGFTDKEYDKQLKKFIRQLKRGPLREMKIKVAMAETEWEHFSKLNKDQWFVSFCVEVTRSTMLPKKTVITKARTAHDELDSLADAGEFHKFSRKAPKAARTVNFALEQMRNYREEMIDGGGNWVTGLETTKWASFTILSVYGAPAAGAALGASALTTAVVGGAALKATESAAGEIGNWTADNKKWKEGGAVSRVLTDAAVGAILGYLAKGASGGKHIVESATKGIVSRLAKLAGFKALSEKTLSKIAIHLLTEGAKGTLEGAVQDAGKFAQQSKKITLEKFLENLVTNFMKGLALGPIGAIVDKYTKGNKIPISDKDRKKISDGVMKQVAKNLKGATHIKEVEKQVKATVDEMLEKVVANTTTKSIEKIIEGIFSDAKGPMSPKALDKAIRDEIMLPKFLEKYTSELTKEVNKKIKKK